MSELVERDEEFEMAINKMIEEQKGLNNSVYSPPVKTETDLELATVFLKVLHHENEGMFELCIHPIKRPERGSGINGAWFKDHNWAAQHFIDCWGENSKKAYTTFNPVKDERGKEQLEWGPLYTRTLDEDIMRLVWVFIDFDPIKADSKGSATDEEKQHAIHAMYEVDKWLSTVGIQECIMGDSGNGGSLFIPIRLPNTPESVNIIQSFLSLISALCENKKLKVNVDSAVSNPARLCPLFPTWGRKGEHTAERPHRKSAILRLPKVDNLTSEVKESNTRIIKSMVEENNRDKPPPERQSSTPIPVDVDDSTKIEQCLRYISKFQPSVSGNQGDNQMKNVAFAAAVLFDLDYEQTFYIIDVFNQSSVPPWPDADLRRFASSAQRAKSKPKYIEAVGCKLIAYAGNYQWQDEVPDIDFSTDIETPVQSVEVSATSVEGLDGAQRQQDHESIEEKSGMKPFPLDVFPPEIREYIENLSHVMGKDPVMVSLPATSILAGIIGASRSAFLYDTYIQPSCLWTAVIADSGSTKTPIMNALFSAINKVDKDLMEDNQKARSQYDIDLSIWESSGKKEGHPKPDKPKYRRIAVDNITIEALCEVMADSRNGVLCSTDELDNWFNSLTNYSKVDNGSLYCKFYDGTTCRIDRKTNGLSILLEKPLYSLSGMVQDAVLAKHMTEERYAQGVASRFIVAWPEKRKSYLRPPKGKVIGTEAWEDMCKKLSELGKTASANLQISTVLEKDGQSAFGVYEAFYNRMEDYMSECKGKISASIASKSRNWALRWALVYSVMKQVLNGNTEANGSIDLESVQKGLKFALWACEETKRCAGLLVEVNSSKEGKELQRWMESRSDGFTARDLHRAMRSKYPSSAMASVACEGLVGEGVLVSVRMDRAAGGEPYIRYRLK